MKQCVTLLTLVLLFGSCTEENSTSSDKNEKTIPDVVVEQPDTTNDENTSEIVEIPTDSGALLNVMHYMQLLHGNDAAAYGPNQEYLNFEVKDVKNGYLSFSGAYEGSTTMALWRKSNGNAVVGQTFLSCGPVCDQRFELQEYSGMNKVTEKQLLSKDAVNTVYREFVDKFIEKYQKEVEEEITPEVWYHLPQNGTSITVTMSYDPEAIEVYLAELTWDGEKFSVGKTYDEIIPYEK